MDQDAPQQTFAVHFLALLGSANIPATLKLAWNEHIRRQVGV